jgi:class 3 adenylate cyclase
MDVHRRIEGLTPDALRAAHLKDLDAQQQFGVHYHKYFFDQATGSVFCLAEGPSAEACKAVHGASHGLLPDEIIEVQPELIDIFFKATRYDDVGAAITNDGKPDGGLRVIMFTEIANYTSVARRSEADAAALLDCHDRAVRDALRQYDGHEVRHTGEGIMACFHSVTPALQAARRIQRDCGEHDHGLRAKPVLRVGLSAGEPVARHHELFGAAVNTARRICEAAEPGQILVSGALRELGVGKKIRFSRIGDRALKGVEEPITLFSLAWRRPVHSDGEQSVANRAAGRVRHFWAEMRRRRVVKVAVAYALVLFGILQVAQLTFAPIGLPEWSYQLVLVLGLIGLPVAVILAWAFDVTPSGVERTVALDDAIE